MDIRVITGDEVQRLEQPDGVPWPAGTDLVCGFQDGKMIGRVACLPLYHLEGTWVDEAHRRSTLAYRLLSRMESELQNAGLTAIWAYSASDEVTDYLKRLGYKEQPVKVLTKEF